MAKIKIGEAKTDLLLFAMAIDKAFPHDCARDRFGRFVGSRDTSGLQQLAVKYREHGVEWAADTPDQAGMVARAILSAIRKA